MLKNKRKPVPNSRVVGSIAMSVTKAQAISILNSVGTFIGMH